MQANSVDSNLAFPEKQTRVAKKILDKGDFLNLLVSQLKNQDPLEPQSNDEFMATMAQFNSLETLSSLDKNIQYGQAMSLIDRQVTVQQPNKDPVTGRVEKAGMVDGKVLIYVQGKEYQLSEVSEILYQDPGLRPATGSDLIQAALMIGREVLINEDGRQLRGTVEKVGMAQGRLQAYVGGVPYDLAGISEIAEAAQAPAGAAEQYLTGVDSGEGAG